MNVNFRWPEYKALLYRLFLGYFFYFVARVLFYAFNTHLFAVSVPGLLRLCWYGLAFDTTALLYINSLFILFSVIPLKINTHRRYQQGLMILYFITNLAFYFTGFVDIVYYRFSQVRTTTATRDLMTNEQNLGKLFAHFAATYWYLIVVFILCCACWIWLYRLLRVKDMKVTKPLVYFSTSVIAGFLILVLMIGGIRGDFAHSTRPINMVDAYKHVTVPNQGDIILNTPFAILRTLSSDKFKVEHWTTADYIAANIKPVKQYNHVPAARPNVMIIILESMAREYWGSMNRNTSIPDFKSYTPFLDSLSDNSLIFTNAYANGRQSIHAMSSILAGIPSFQTAFTSSPYAKQKIQSIVSICDSLGYQTSFFHGAANGSMGFQGFGSILGYKHYYGRTEYNNDKDFDGIWGIWDEPFGQFIGRTITSQKQPFLATWFTLSSHDPFQIPAKYKDRFTGGPLPIDKCVQYSDNALRHFFAYAKTQSWYSNTIFVITADHTSQTYYPEYSKPVNRFAVPILLFSPNASYNLKGVRTDLAQQMDIYPTLVDLIGYNKPFRSWGRSLTANSPAETPRVINSPGNIYQFMEDNYIYVFDGNQFSGIFAIGDKGLKDNLLKGTPNAEMTKGMQDCKALIQDYNDRIINKKLGGPDK